MGSPLKAIGGAALGPTAGIAGPALALGGIAGDLGAKKGESPSLMGARGRQFSGAVERAGREQEAMREAGLARAAADYGQGNMSLADLVGQAGTGEFGAGRLQEIATNPFSGSQMATEMVQNNPMLGQLYGQDSTLSRTVGEEQDLAQRGYSLQPEDYEAYGQASGDIGRMFGTQEQSLAQALQSRGLGGAGSGAAGAEFTGLQGNKFEQLGKLQTDIAQKRMQSNMERLGNTRQFLGQLGAQGGREIQNQFGRQIAGRQSSEAARAQRMSEQQAGATMEQNRLAAEQGLKTPDTPGFGERMLNNTMGAISQVPGSLIGGMTGGASKGLGYQGAGVTGGASGQKALYTQKG